MISGSRVRVILCKASWTVSHLNAGITREQKFGRKAYKEWVHNLTLDYYTGLGYL